MDGLRFSNQIERLPGYRMNRLLAGVSLPASNGHIDITRFELHAITDSADSLSGQQSTARSQEAIEHQISGREAAGAPMP